MQNGCNKPICFNKYCKNNVMAAQPDTRSEKELSDFVQFLVRKTSDPSELVCAEAVLHDEKTSKKKVPYRELLYLKNVSPLFLL